MSHYKEPFHVGSFRAYETLLNLFTCRIRTISMCGGKLKGNGTGYVSINKKSWSVPETAGRNCVQ